MKAILIRSGCVLGLVVLLLPRGAAVAASYPLTVQTMDFAEAKACPGGYGAYGQLQGEAPAGLKEIPKLVSSEPLFCQITYSGRTMEESVPGMFFVFDESQGTGKGYDRMVVDLNGNGDLTDDPVQEAFEETEQGSGAVQNSAFGPVDLPEDRRMGQWRPRFFGELAIYNRSVWRSMDESFPFMGNLRIYAANYLRATVEGEGGKEVFGLVDGNCNFRLADAAQLLNLKYGNGETRRYLMPGDYFLRDRDGSGKFENRLDGRESEMFANLVYLGRRPQSVEVSPDLGTLHLSEYGDPVGKLSVTERVTDLEIVWERGAEAWEALTPRIQEGQAIVPVGVHRMATCAVGAKGRDNQCVKLGSASALERTFEVTEGQTCSLDAGLPLGLRVTAVKGRPRGGVEPGVMAAIRNLFTRQTEATVLELNVTVIGAGGEQYAEFVDLDKNERIPPPRFEILGPDGQSVASGDFEYG